MLIFLQSILKCEIKKLESGKIHTSVFYLLNSTLPYRAITCFCSLLILCASISAKAQAVATDHVAYTVRHVFDFPMKDPDFISAVKLEYGRDGLPQKYTTILSTPVCDDGLCQVLELKVYWNLIGNYVNYDTVAGMPLTKFDHLPFVDADYEKLHQILADQHSVLERKSLDELFDSDSLRQSNRVDATTGATDQAIKHAIVEGALYSSYALWHLVNGNVKTKIQEHTKAIYSPGLAERLLKSNDYQEQLFVLKLCEDEDFEIYFDHVLNLIVTSNPLLEMYILKRLPDAMWQEKTFQNQLVRVFPELTPNGRGLLFSKLSTLNTIEASCLIFLSNHIPIMSISQLKVLLKMLVKFQMVEHEVIQEHFKSASNSMDDKAFYIEEFLIKTK